MSANEAISNVGVHGASPEEIKQGVRDVYASRVSGDGVQVPGADWPSGPTSSNWPAIRPRTWQRCRRTRPPTPLAAATRSASAASSRGTSSSTSGRAPGWTRCWRPGWSAPSGTVIGLDMTPEMIAKATENARACGRSQRRVPSRRCRADAAARCHRGLDHLELRDQPGARQGQGLRRDRARAEAGRPRRDLRHRHGGPAARGPAGHGSLGRVRRRRDQRG